MSLAEQGLELSSWFPILSLVCLATLPVYSVSFQIMLGTSFWHTDKKMRKQIGWTVRMTVIYNSYKAKYGSHRSSFEVIQELKLRLHSKVLFKKVTDKRRMLAKWDGVWATRHPTLNLRPWRWVMIPCPSTSALMTWAHEVLCEK